MTSSSSAVSSSAAPTGVEFEPHYAPKQVSKLWGVSADTVRKIFANEPGVLCFGTGETRHKRGYFIMRIPESVMRRVHMKWRKRSSSVQ